MAHLAAGTYLIRSDARGNGRMEALAAIEAGRTTEMVPRDLNAKPNKAEESGARVP